MRSDIFLSYTLCQMCDRCEVINIREVHVKGVFIIKYKVLRINNVKRVKFDRDFPRVEQTKFE